MSRPATTAEWNADRTAQLLDVTREHLYVLARAGTIPKPIDGAWAAVKCNVAYIRHLRDRHSASSKEDKSRKLKAEADMAEMESARMEGTLCLRSDYISNWADAIAHGVSRISRLKTLTTAQKESVFAALRELKLPELEPETPQNDGKNAPSEEISSDVKG